MSPDMVLVYFLVPKEPLDANNADVFFVIYNISKYYYLGDSELFSSSIFFNLPLDATDETASIR